MSYIYSLFIGKIAEQKALQRLTNQDLADLTGFKRKTIEAFMCGARPSEKVAEALARALKIER